jgi:hypothetical protein
MDVYLAARDASTKLYVFIVSLHWMVSWILTIATCLSLLDMVDSALTLLVLLVVIVNYLSV